MLLKICLKGQLGNENQRMSEMSMTTGFYSTLHLISKKTES